MFVAHISMWLLASVGFLLLGVLGTTWNLLSSSVLQRLLSPPQSQAQQDPLTERITTPVHVGAVVHHFFCLSTAKEGTIKEGKQIGKTRSTPKELRLLLLFGFLKVYFHQQGCGIVLQSVTACLQYQKSKTTQNKQPLTRIFVNLYRPFTSSCLGLVTSLGPGKPLSGVLLGLFITSIAARANTVNTFTLYLLAASVHYCHQVSQSSSSLSRWILLGRTLLETQ